MGHPLIQGRKGGNDSPRTPVESPDSLQSTSYAKILLALGEGEFAGELDGTNIFLDNTPIMGPDGQANFEGVKWEFRPGTPHQEYIPGMPAVENELTVGTELMESWVRSVTNTQLSAVRLRLSWPQLQTQKEDGDTVGYRIDYVIEVATDGGAYQELPALAVDGKTTTKYERSHRVDLPKAYSGWQVRIRRLTPKQISNRIADAMVVEAITEVIDAKLSYPETALLFVQFDAKQFRNIPQVSCEPKMRIIRVPDNYDPTSRTYTGIWQGAFKWAWTDNPAWVLYDLLSNDRFSIGTRVKAENLSLAKWDLYRIAQYCDQLVPDGKGGTEPRFTCNVYIQSQEEAWTVLRDIAGIFRGMTFWANNNMNVLADMPRDVDYLYTRANVQDGKFSYASASEKTHYSTAMVSWSDPQNGYQDAVEPVFDHRLIRRFQVRQADVAAIGCTRQSEANRRGKWVLHTNEYDRMVTFTVGLDGRIPLPGYIIGVADEMLSGRVLGGRISAAEGRNMTLDRISSAKVGERLILNLPSGKAEGRTIQAVNGKIVTVSAEYTEIPASECAWAIDASDLAIQLFRVTGIKEGEGGVSFDITAVEHNPDKYTHIDTGTRLDERPISVIPPGVQPPPKNVTIESYSTVHQGIAVTTLRVTWDAAESAIAYEAEWRRDNGNWIPALRTATQGFEVPNIYAGRYQARVRAINAAEISSLWANAAETHLKGKAGNPPAPRAFRATPIVFGIQLEWGFAPQTDDTLKTEIQYSPTHDGEGLMLLADIPYPQKTHTMQGLSAGVVFYFRARLVDKSGNQSPWTDFIRGESSSDASGILKMVGDQFLSSESGKRLEEKIDFNREKTTELARHAQELGNKALNLEQQIGEVAEGVMTNTHFSTQISHHLQEEVRDRKADITRLEQVQANEQAAHAKFQEQISADVENNRAAVLGIRESQSTQEKTVAKEINQVKVSLQTTDESLEAVTGRVTQNTEAIATANEVQAQFEQTTKAEFAAQRSDISKVEKTVTDAESAVAEALIQTSAQFNTLNDQQLESTARIVHVEKAVATESEARAEMGQQLTTRLEDTESAIVDVRQTQSETDKALADSRTQLRAEIQQGDKQLQESMDLQAGQLSAINSTVNEQKTAIADLEHSTTTLQHTQQSQYATQQAQITHLNETLNNQERSQAESALQLAAQASTTAGEQRQIRAEISRVDTARASDSQAFTQSMATLTAKVGENGAMLEEKATAVFDIDGNGYAIKDIGAGVKFNGQFYKAGMVIGAEVKNGQVRTDIGFNAENFGWFNPSSGKMEPFMTAKNGQLFIRDAFIDTATIQRLMVGLAIQSTNYVPNQRGFRMDAGTGFFEMNGGQGQAGISIKSNGIQLRDSQGRIRIEMVVE